MSRTFVEWALYSLCRVVHVAIFTHVNVHECTRVRLVCMCGAHLVGVLFVFFSAYRQRVCECLFVVHLSEMHVRSSAQMCVFGVCQCTRVWLRAFLGLRMSVHVFVRSSMHGVRSCIASLCLLCAACGASLHHTARCVPCFSASMTPRVRCTCSAGQSA